MLRLANPGSDLGTFVKIFNVLVEAYGDGRVFTLDDATETLVLNNLATSCGYMGEEAIARSRRDDRSRDPLYNQLKMYSELLRLLGWIRPSSTSRQAFHITYFGLHVPRTGFSPRRLVREALLGIAVPSPGLDSKGDYQLRPFLAILRAMEALDGLLSRDEMIVGPLDLDNDRDSGQFNRMVAALKKGRRGGSLDALLSSLLARRGISAVTAGNYTRFPIAALEWTGWAEKVRLRHYGRPTPFLRLTDVGRVYLDACRGCVDIRWSDIEKQPAEVINAYSELGFQRLLDRSGFDVSPRDGERAEAARRLAGAASTSQDLLFSPFQQAPPTVCDRLFPPPRPGQSHGDPAGATASSTTAVGRRNARPAEVMLVCDDEPGAYGSAGPALNAIRSASGKVGADPRRVALEMCRTFSSANKDVFYPLVADLFCVLGFKCEVSRAGVNYQRWDAFVTDTAESFPIEIKSPGEEAVLSVKGVRQAFENKVILTARGGAPSTTETASLVVGFGVPNERAEVADLVSDIHAAFGVRIGVIGFEALSLLAATAVLTNRKPAKITFTRMLGVLDV